MVELSVNISGLVEARSAISKFQTGFGKRGKWALVVGAEYGAFVEFGTSRMAAQPYLFPAVEKVFRSDFARIEQAALKTSEPMVYIVRELIKKAAAEAKIRAPYLTGYLRGSIAVSPRGAWS